MPYEIPSMPEVGEIQEPKIPCVILLDTSGSLSGCENEILSGVQTLVDCLLEEEIARGRIDLCLIEYNSSVQVLQNFALARDVVVPSSLHCSGLTSTHEAVKVALEMVKARQQQYVTDYHIVHKRPWIWLFSDGNPTDADNGSFQELMDLQLRKKVVFFGIGVGDSSAHANLGAMSKKGLFLKISRENFKEAFSFISQSVAEASEPNFTGEIAAPTAESGIETYQVKDSTLSLL